MSFLKKITALFSAGSSPDNNTHEIQVQCNLCREILTSQVYLNRDLSEQDDGTYISRKTLVGNNRCFQRVEVTLHFDQSRNLFDQEISGGTFVAPPDPEEPDTD